MVGDAAELREGTRASPFVRLRQGSEVLREL